MMKAYNNANRAKDLLLQFQIYAKTLSKRGPTDITVYLENFAAKLMEIYYGYSFVNMNYASKNFAGIDLLNKQENHGIQFTIQDNSTDKIINSIKKSEDYSKITVFFFNTQSVNTIVRHAKKREEWNDNVEVISLYDIFSVIDQDPIKADLYKDLCELWINGNTQNYTDLVDKFNDETEKRIERNVRSKKYIPEIYISEINLKKTCRVFADPCWATEEYLHKISSYFVGYCYGLFKNIKAELKDGEKISFKDDCDIQALLRLQYPEQHMDVVIHKLNNYVKMTRSVKNGIRFFNEDQELDYNDMWSNYNSSICFTIEKDIHLYEFSNKKYYFIVKDAGQGKTNFLCDLCKNVYVKKKIPTVYLNVNELAKNLLDTFKDQISLVVGRDFNESLELINQYCLVSNKKLIICVDGLNEKNNLSEFKNEVLELFRFADCYDFIKIIATSRNKAYQVYFNDFKSESFGDLIAENIEEDKGYYGRKSEEFKRKIFAKYRDYFDVSCYISSDAKKKLTNDTLLLRLFCEVYEHNSDAIINDIFLYDLFSLYIKKRSDQLLKSGKIKREEDLLSLLHKIAKTLITSHNLNEFSYSGFTSEEKDLLDIIVQEDIIIKSSDDNGILLFGDRTSFSFTYDEFRDFLIANILLYFEENEFKKELDIICTEAERYDGVLKYLFIFCKTKNGERLSYLEECSVYRKIYSENILSIDDCYLTADDVSIIRGALKDPKYKWVYNHVARRLDVTRYKKLSVIDIVDTYLECFKGRAIWNNIFFDKNYYQEEQGILPELLKAKYMDTREDEIYGILLLLCTISIDSESEETYLKWLRKAHEKTYTAVLLEVIKTQKELSFAAINMLKYGGK